MSTFYLIRCPYSTQYCCTEKATTAADACCGPKFEWYFLT